MPKTYQRPGYVYKHVAIPEAAYARIEAYATRMGLPITQAVGLILNVATGPSGIVMTAEEAAEVGEDALVQLATARRARRRDLGGTHQRASGGKESAGAGI